MRFAVRSSREYIFPLTVGELILLESKTYFHQIKYTKTSALQIKRYAHYFPIPRLIALCAPTQCENYTIREFYCSNYVLCCGELFWIQVTPLCLSYQYEPVVSCDGILLVFGVNKILITLHLQNIGTILMVAAPPLFNAPSSIRSSPSSSQAATPHSTTDSTQKRAKADDAVVVTMPESLALNVNSTSTIDFVDSNLLALFLCCSIFLIKSG